MEPRTTVLMVARRAADRRMPYHFTVEIPNSGETVELLQQLIRNECVNDGTPDSGNERANSDVLQTYLEGDGLDVQCFTSLGDRTSIVARIDGSVELSKASDRWHETARGIRVSDV